MTLSADKYLGSSIYSLEKIEDELDIDENTDEELEDFLDLIDDAIYDAKQARKIIESKLEYD